MNLVEEWFGSRESISSIDFSGLLNLNCIEDISVFDSWKNNLESLLNLYLANNAFDKSKNEKTIKILEELVEFEC